MGFLLTTTRRSEMLDGWTFFSVAKNQPIYVVLTPPGGQGPLPLPLAGLPIEHLEVLRALRRDDAVPPRIIAGLLTLAPASVLRQQFPPRF